MWYNEIEEDGMKTIFDYDIKDYSSFKIGGICRVAYFPEKDSDFLEILDKEDNPLIIGNMTNILFTDGHFNRAVIILNKNFSNAFVEDGSIIAEAGMTMPALSRFAYKNEIGGLEFMEGIPGSIGGGVIMNAGAYGTEFKDIVDEVKVLRDGKILWVDNAECEFSSRHSIFQNNKDIVLAARFKGEKKDAAAIKRDMDDFHERRISKQPIDYPSCGSVFKRPKDNYASKLIDDLGLKGRSVGGAEVSTKHAGFIINKGNATFKDVLDLIEIVKSEVKSKTGIELEPELRIIEE